MTTTASITCAGCKHSYAETALFCPNCGRPKVREAAGDPLVGKLLGERFQIQEQIGQGGSGTIYRAEHVTLRRKVAIKVLHQELSRDDLAVERFRREATTVAEIDNEHIVEIHDFGRTPDGRLYLAMELLEGEGLDSVLAREKTLSVEKAADILIQVGEALMEAHAIGYIHRDLRPRNIFLAVRRGRANFVKLFDFGLAKLVESDASAASTSLGMTFGDPRYMSPEQARGDRIDRRADIYQLGCVAYEMITGAPPFTGNRVFDILTKQVTEIPAPLPTRRPGVPLWMEAAVAKMLAKDPENRFATTTRMVEALRRGLETGEVMEDEVARRRESIPPPSVSRVMQKFGVSTPGDAPIESPPKPELPATVTSKQTMRYEEPKPSARDLERKRTGTPRVGVPAVAPAEAVPAPVADKAPSAPVVQPPVAGSIEAPSGRAKQPDSAGISQVWYEDGERESRGEDGSRKIASSSVTDTSLYDEPARGKRWPLLAAGGGVVVLLGVAIAFAMKGGAKDKSAPAPAPQTQQVATAPIAPIDAPPSQELDTPDAAAATQVAAKPAETPAAKKDPPVVAPAKTDHRVTTTEHKATGNAGDLWGGNDDLAKRRPGGTSTSNSGPTNTTVVVPPPNTTTKPDKPGVSGADGPQDPYGADPGADSSADGSPEKKAEFYANLGQQQLMAGDTGNAAASFKKASELDPKNATAVTGMGEIALRQGLFGDAIAHLRKAARLAPKSSRVFTLLGEAYLSSGQNATAADNFKKALQLDPDNARARDGYNDASSKVPPPTDDN